MVSAILVAHTHQSADDGNVRRVIESLKSARVLNCVALIPDNEPAWGELFSPFLVTTIQAAAPAKARSISAGISACDQKDLHGVLVVSLDAPGITQGIIASALHEFWTSHQPIVIAQTASSSNITILSGKLFEEIHRAGETALLSEILAAHNKDTRVMRFDELGKMIRGSTPVETLESKEDDA